MCKAEAGTDICLATRKPLQRAQQIHESDRIVAKRHWDLEGLPVSFDEGLKAPTADSDVNTSKDSRLVLMTSVGVVRTRVAKTHSEADERA